MCIGLNNNNNSRMQEEANESADVQQGRSRHAKRKRLFQMLEQFLPGIIHERVETARRAYQELSSHILWALWERAQEIAEEGTVANAHPACAPQDTAELITAKSKIDGIVDKLKAETDRAMVLEVGLLVEEQLRSMLREYFVQDNVSDEFVQQNLPCLPVLARAAYCFGLISKTEFESINEVRKIRNDFAHKFIHNEFDGTLKAKASEVMALHKKVCMAQKSKVALGARTRFEEITVAILAPLWRRNDRIANSKMFAELRE